MLVVLFGLVLLVAVLAAIAKGKRGIAGSRVGAVLLACKPTVMDKWEAELYECLVVTLKASHVFPQVAMSAFLKEAERRNGGRNVFAQKYVDFLVCERGTFKPLYVIELDGRSHGSARAREKDAQRDSMLAAAGIPVKRYTSSKVDVALVLRDYMEVVGPVSPSPSEASTPRPASSAASSLGGV
ncbi:DUF2726 domain-containing protein [Ralstonia solanacearum]|uniref:DUF2726 domain-containing protein n=1 Tax=Ralstonia solanacearum TaxID=305 RepID=A0AAD0S5E8_RALSL|nr:DUF2726 domain-containing protein [Ralstonia solanacearum]AXV80953.1 hypothetical protein CJO77_04985 [Ralstonia solanacearum]AXW52097.1 hypothetical protein CJO92_04985 [Ralstonia solanacearum]